MISTLSAYLNCRNGSSLWLLLRYRLGPSAWEEDGMVELPRSLPEFEARFPDDAACARWLLAKRWPDGFRCPACGHDRAWELGRERLTLQCAACERQVSVTAGTVLHGSHLPLRTWFLAAWLLATHKNGMSARQLWLQLGLGSYKSAWLLLRKLRRAMVDPEREPLAGLVEVDETSLPFRAGEGPAPPGPPPAPPQAHLHERVFRFNRRRTPHAAFDRLLGLSLTLEPATYQMLVV